MTEAMLTPRSSANLSSSALRYFGMTKCTLSDLLLMLYYLLCNALIVVLYYAYVNSKSL